MKRHIKNRFARSLCQNRGVEGWSEETSSNGDDAFLREPFREVRDCMLKRREMIS